ncbi:MAG: hypothetical protein MR902_07425 [Campylobacter sp.]|nr:hypothetical protein [Campylobacter sp.]
MLVDINSGDIDKKLSAKITEIKKSNPNLKIYTILNKANKKPPSARTKILNFIKDNNAFVGECILYSLLIGGKEFDDKRDEILKILRGVV